MRSSFFRVSLNLLNGASFLLASLVLSAESRDLQDTCGSCRVPITFDTTKHQETYKVGVLNFRGPESAYSQHNSTFATYLSATAGQHFEPAIKFEMVPVDFQTMFDVAAEGSVDFLYVSPSPFACLEAEYGAQSLVSHISKRTVSGNSYELQKFGGVIAVRADNDEINTIQDLRNKVIGSAAISSFGGGQMQFRELQNAGLSYINDPKQMVFTGNQAAIVNGVVDGEFDAGFVRTDQIERTVDSSGNPIDSSLLKVLEPKEQILDGEIFPFISSTQLYPEWNLAAMKYVHEDVSAEVQAAMLALRGHSIVGQALENCDALMSENPSTTNETGLYQCEDITLVIPEARCDTTDEVAQSARIAMVNGKYAGFRTTQSYIEIRAMLQDTDFITKDEETNTWRCARPAFLYEAISCPPGHFKKTEEEVLYGCANDGLACGEGFTCICNPCTKAYDVSVAPIDQLSTPSFEEGCSKMSVCGITQQKKPLTFRAVDNKKRSGKMTVIVHGGDVTREILVQQDALTNSFEFTVISDQIGILILEMSLDGEQIPESPLRVLVEDRECEDDRQEADVEGECICVSNTIDIGSSCVSFAVFLPSILAAVGLAVFVFVYYYIRRTTKEADSVWYVPSNELKFDEPAEIIGSGSFGLVLLADYRGTKVAVKRALPPRERSSNFRSPTAKATLSGDGNSSGVFSSSGASTTKSDQINRSVEKALSIVNATDEEIAQPAKTINFLDGSSGFSSGSGGSSSQCSRSTKKANKATTSGTISGKVSRFFRRGRSSSHSFEKEQFIKEMRLLSKLRHPCITTVMGAVVEKGNDPLLIMEYMDHGSLHDIIHNDTFVLDGELTLNILRDIAQGIRFLHSASPPVVHGDMKSANVLVDSKFRAKVADFGLAHYNIGAAIGTPFWMGPELLRGESNNSTASDMYSVGMILYEIYSRKDPYEGENDQEVLRLLCNKSAKKRPPVPKSCPPKMSKLMKFLLQEDPALRPTAEAFDNRVSELNVSNVQPGDQKTSHRRGMQQSGNSSDADMLQQIFPKHIAEVLRTGGKVEAESHENVTIFFSDVVGFTTIASDLSPMKVSELLDRLYLKLDALSRKYDLFKIETIGDAYMCAANLAEDQSADHVKRIAEFALEAVEIARHIPVDEGDPAQGTIQIRVGFHSGPVVSNVVGSLNPRFGLFGDTVNVANRMESTSIPGKIQCSERSAHLLLQQAPKMLVSTRGKTQVKGKGEMITCWLHKSRAYSYVR